MPRIVLSIIIVLAFVLPSARAGKEQQIELERAIQTRKIALENIQADLQEKKAIVKDLESQEKQHLGKLYAIDEQLNLNNQLINTIGKQISDINSLMSEKQIQLEINQKDLEYRQAFLNDRLVWIYKKSRFSETASALSATDLSQAARRLYMFSLLNRYDRNMITEIESLIVQIDYEKVDLQQQKKTTLELQAEKQRQLTTFKQNRLKRKGLIREVRAQKDIELKGIRQLNEDQERLSGIIETLLESQKILDTEAAEAFKNLKGKLLWPVKGKILRKFGKIKDKKYNTVISNPGIDINAEAGIKVVAASTGEAAYISWLRGYGSFVILDHGGGYYSLYAHLDDIFVEKGQFITAGEYIATVGETGSLSGPLLHFELRYGKEQLDPLPWLR
ncbi:MAG: peptidoglycan DD-metalloendopeptidase family protein [candidate division Zixibacteria bacterium]|nr:peptidoglycan DD-metalloendopeptidase family protein [candidate division Zixibacteria bacterium]